MFSPARHHFGELQLAATNERFSFGAGLLEILEKEEISGLCWHGALLL
jgi:hypothetical protein